MNLIVSSLLVLCTASVAVAAFVFGLAAGVPPSLLSPWRVAGYAAVLAFCLALVLSGSFRIGLRRGGLCVIPRLPLVFVTVHVACVWGLLAEIAQGAGTK